ncbi:MAG: hypothetical protein WDM77_07130 [Steroidobacteraceae bacterium]
MKQPHARVGNVRTLRPSMRVAPPESEGIVVQEEELSSASAQRVYRMRCQCGRSWFELELKVLVKCPACAKLNRVHLT